MTVKKKLQKAARKLRMSGFSVRRPDYDRDGKGNILWIFPSRKSDVQVGCISVSTNSPDAIHVSIVF